MSFCPSCSFEYEIGVGVCPDCSVQLAETPFSSRFAMLPDDSWSHVYSSSSSAIRKGAVGILNASNIPSAIMSAELQEKCVAVGKRPERDFDDAYIILVPKEFKDEARFLLREFVKSNARQAQANLYKSV